MALPDLTDLFIAECYRGYLHTSNTPLTGSEYVRVYDGLGNPSALQLNSEGIKVGDNIYDTEKGEKNQILKSDGEKASFEYIFPVGAVYLSMTDTNPSEYFGGEWERVAEGKFLAGVGEGEDKNQEKFTVESGDDSAIGEYTHQLTIAEIPEHTHFTVGMDRTGGYLSENPSKVVSWISNQSSGNLDYALFQSSNADGGPSSSIGEGDSHNNKPPFFGVYVWRRTA